MKAWREHKGTNIKVQTVAIVNVSLDTDTLPD